MRNPPAQAVRTVLWLSACRIEHLAVLNAVSIGAQLAEWTKLGGGLISVITFRIAEYCTRTNGTCTCRSHRPTHPIAHSLRASVFTTACGRCLNRCGEAREVRREAAGPLTAARPGFENLGDPVNVFHEQVAG